MIMENNYNSEEKRDEWNVPEEHQLAYKVWLRYTFGF